MAVDITYAQARSYDQAYFRRRLGEGVCDDLALIRIGAEHLGGLLRHYDGDVDLALMAYNAGEMDEPSEEEQNQAIEIFQQFEFDCDYIYVK